MPNIMDWSVLSPHPIPSKLATKLNLHAEVGEVEGVVEVLGVDEVAEGAGTEEVAEVKASKQTANMRLIVKVGQAIHLMHNLLPHPPVKFCSTSWNISSEFWKHK